MNTRVSVFFGCLLFSTLALGMGNPLNRDANGKTALHRAALQGNKAAAIREVRCICCYYVQTLALLRQKRTNLQGFGRRTHAARYGTLTQDERELLRSFYDCGEIIDQDLQSRLKAYIVNRLEDLSIDVLDNTTLAGNNAIASWIRADNYKKYIQELLQKLLRVNVY